MKRKFLKNNLIQDLKASFIALRKAKITFDLGFEVNFFVNNFFESNW